MQVTSRESTKTFGELSISLTRIDTLCREFIEGRWAESKNAYHNPEHIRDVVLLCEAFCNKIEFKDEKERNITMITTKCAAWFHDMFHSGRKGVQAEQENITVAITSFVVFFDNTPEINALGDGFKFDVIRIIKSTTHPYIPGFNDVLTRLDEQIVRDADNMAVWALDINTSQRNSWIWKVSGLVDEIHENPEPVSPTARYEEKEVAATLAIYRVINLEIGFLKLLKDGILKIYTAPGQQFFDERYPRIISSLNSFIQAAHLLYPESEDLKKITIIT